MRRRDLLLGAVAALAAAGCQRQRSSESTPDASGETGGEGADYPDPAQAIVPLYERYRTDPAVTTFPVLLEQAPWSGDLRAKLEAMMARSRQTEEPILDFDPFVNAQDWQIASVNVTTDGVVANSHATVRAHFVNGATEDEVVYDLVWEGGGWRVDNIRNASWDLRQIVTQSAAP